VTNNIISAGILILFFYARSLYKTNPKLHVRMMILVMFLDLSLVAYLAVFRDALSKINADISVLLLVHLFFALSTVLLYFRMAYAGYLISKGNEASRRLMRKLDKVMIFTRVFTLITSIALSFNS
jgi:hypothetical protein